jgi:hypothetical protein
MKMLCNTNARAARGAIAVFSNIDFQTATAIDTAMGEQLSNATAST